MKNDSKKIAANEINRFLYCPYQWYYMRSYGNRVLNEKYKALDIGRNEYETNFVKGQKFHRDYYRSYRFKRMLQIVSTGLAVGLLGWLVMRWR